MKRIRVLYPILVAMGALFAVVVMGQASGDSQAASPSKDLPAPVALDTDQAAPQSSVRSPLLEVSEPLTCTTETTCPAGPAGLDFCVERDKFCVYYTTNSITEAEAEWAADRVADYWNRFVALGFNEPKYSGQLRVVLSDTLRCNGATGWDYDYIEAWAGCFSFNTERAQKVLGHELTHRVQYAYDTGTGAPVQMRFLKEGTARASEDNWFTGIDHWNLAPYIGSSFNSQVNDYLLFTNTDLTGGFGYHSCLWWKYASEQYGTITTEPERGVDFFLQVYQQNTAGHRGIAAINRALAAMGAGTTFDESFTRFAVANWTKDLTGVPDGSYNYIDEDEPGNPEPYGPLDPEDGGTIQIGTSASWNDHRVAGFGLRYYSAEIDPTNCPVVSASFHRDSGGPTFYHVVTQEGDAFRTHVRGSGDDWSQAFLNDGITQTVAIVGSLENSSQVDVSLSCGDPVIEIQRPNRIAVAHVQPSRAFLAQVLVTNGSPNGPVVAGLTDDDFSAEVGGSDASIAAGGFIQEQYWLVIQAPSLGDGTYDLEIMLEEPGTGTVIASDVNTQSVTYAPDNTDQLLVIDRSGSMGVEHGEKMAAAIDAANLYVDITRDGDGLAVVPYRGDVSPSPFHLRPVDGSVRDDAKAFIRDLSASGATSIGDGLGDAAGQRASSPTGNPRCSFVLLSDGMENAALYWADVMTDVLDSGCPVTAVALGTESDETLMQDIATATGGPLFFNDVYVSAPKMASLPTYVDMALQLGGTYEYAQAQGEGRQRLLAESSSSCDLEGRRQCRHLSCADTRPTLWCDRSSDASQL